ncbi:hypothetical protein QFC22_001451 [Naganishia vaughanmartiniae]|uniref:Uncharacterized protein n=1 Tax=Naganishia vaughanmartiniae TaxID=1424756 RepID=A0ACC2XIM6_9TREE|nr:hypothetical protein QFC22_001451 [Naganishia vaughanmartiniae]
MPSTLQHTPVASSNLLIGIESDTSEMGAKSGRARSMAERLAKRFHSQIFLSLDIPPAMSLLASIGPSSDVGGSGSGGALTGMGSRGMGMGGGLPGLDSLGDKLYLGLEKALVGVLEQVGGIA